MTQKASIAYFLGGKRVLSRSAGKGWGSSVTLFGGTKVNAPYGSGPTVYAVTGARARLSKQRFSFSAPFLLLEQPLNKTRSKTSFLGVLRPGWKVTSRLTLANEWTVRLTRFSKPKVTYGGFASFGPFSSVTVEAGVYRTNAGTSGARLQLNF